MGYQETWGIFMFDFDFISSLDGYGYGTSMGTFRQSGVCRQIVTNTA